jgi:hypothetical protein
VTPSFGQRVLALAAAALLAAVLALAVARQSAGTARAAGPQPAVGAGVGWYDAVAGVYTIRSRRSNCRWLLEPGTLGIVHPVLPCGTKVFLDYGGKRVYTQVVDRAAVPSSVDFDVTSALADRIGLSGTRDVRWAFAR